MRGVVDCPCEKEDCPCEKEEDEKEDSNCPQSLPLERWRVGNLASTQISQPVGRCRG